MSRPPSRTVFGTLLLAIQGNLGAGSPSVRGLVAGAVGITGCACKHDRKPPPPLARFARISLSLPLSSLSLPPSSVGNLPFGMTEEMLAETFSEVGPVKSSR